MKKLIVFMMLIFACGLLYGQSIERMPKIFTNTVYFAGPLSMTTTDGALDITMTNTTAAGDRTIQANITQSTSVALTGTLDGIYARATGGDTGGAGTIRGAEIGGRITDTAGNIATTVTGGYFWADTKARATTNLRGVEVSLDGSAGGTATLAAGVEVFNNSSGTQTTSIAYDVNEGSPTGRKAFTYDFRGQNGETISNATNGYWILSATRTQISGILETVGNVYIGAADGYTSTGTTIGSAGTISAKGAIIGDATIAAGTSFNPDAAGGAALGTTALEFSNLFLTDGGIVYFGADQDVTLTHVADTGLLLNTTRSIQFGDATEMINASTNGQLDIDATTEVEIATGTLDLNGALDISGPTTTAGTYDATALSSTSAGGDIGADVDIFQTGTALTGDLIGIKGNARIDVESASGKAIGGYFQAGNYAGGFGLDIARGVYVDVVNKVPAAAGVTWNTARGYEVSMDLDQGTSGHTNTITTAQMFYGVYNLPTSGTYATVTNGYGVYLKNEAVGGTGQALDAALYIADASMSGGIKGWDYGIDLSGVAAGYTNADIKLANGETISNDVNGTIKINGQVNFAAAGGTYASSVGIIHGAGASGLATAYSVGAVAGNTKAMSYYLKSTSQLAADVLEGLYVNTYHGTDAAQPAPSGEAGRFRAYLTGDQSGAVALVGMHGTLELAAGSSIGGLGVGVRGNIVFPAEAQTGTIYGVQAELYSGGANTDMTTTTSAPLNIAISGTITAAKWANVPAFRIDVPADLVSTNAYILDTNAAADDCDAKLKINVNGTDWWIMLSNTND